MKRFNIGLASTLAGVVWLIILQAEEVASTGEAVEGGGSGKGVPGACHESPGEHRIGAIDGGVGDFVPPPWMDGQSGKTWPPRHEHGLNDGFNDSEEESEAEHMQALGESVNPPGWYTKLRLQLRHAQQGKWWEKGMFGGTAGSLGINRHGTGDHEEVLWNKMHKKMEQMCDPGCGHDVVGFHEGRDYIRSVMMQGDPRRNGQDITERIRRNRQLSDEAKMRARMEKRRREAAGKGQDCSSDSDSESLSKSLAQQILPESIGGMGRRGMFGEVIRLDASTFHDNIMRKGVDRLHVLLLDDEGREDCAIIGSIFSQLARSLPSSRVRFFMMQYHQALPDLDRATELPTILFYCGGDILFRTKGLSDLGGVSNGSAGRVNTHLGRDEFRMRLMKSISAVVQDVSVKQACLQKAARDRNPATGFGTISSDSESGSA